jgi:hypothetical protein
MLVLMRMLRLMRMLQAAGLKRMRAASSAPFHTYRDGHAQFTAQ